MLLRFPKKTSNIHGEFSPKKKQVKLDCLHQYWTPKFLNPQCINPSVRQRSCGTVPSLGLAESSNSTSPVPGAAPARKPGTPGTWGSRPSKQKGQNTKSIHHGDQSIQSLCGEVYTVHQNVRRISVWSVLFNPQISGQDQLGCYHTDVDAVNEAITWCIHNEQQKYALKTWNCQPRRCDKLTTLVIFAHSVRILSLPPYSDRHCGENICCSLKTADTFPH